MLTIFFFLALHLPLAFAGTCPHGGVFDPNFNKCYIYYSQPAVFLAAESTCRSIGGNLAEIRNGFENTFVAGIVYNFNNGTSSSAYWVGANLLMAPSWTWTTNDTVLYTNWAADQPSDPSIFQCASVREDTYLWNKELCSSVQPFVCTANPSNAPAPDNSPCDQGYTQYENQCFKLFTDFLSPMNYYDSSAFCRVHENATLPKITSVGIQDFLHGLIYDHGSDMWLGLGCYATGATSCWWWDGSYPIYTNWQSGSPWGQHPVYMIGSNGQWNTIFGFSPIGKVVVCEKPTRNM